LIRERINRLRIADCGLPIAEKEEKL